MTPGTASVGAWRIAGDPGLFAAVRTQLEQADREARAEHEVRALGEFRAYFKGSALRGKHALRHALRGALGIGELPRLQEFANLAWLRENGFLAPRPLLAGARLGRGVARYQFLYSEFLDGAPTLAEFFSAAPTSPRLAVLEALARDVARLHALGFVHRDLFARNLLVCSRPAGVRIAFLDAWRAAPGNGWRGPDHDLGCLFLDGAGLFEPEEQRFFLRTYAGEGARSGLRVPPDWARRITEARRRVHRRESKRRPGLRTSWDCPRPA